jgi:16S rRNA (cytidine1402-2'-O)-methyltransferase
MIGEHRIAAQALAPGLYLVATPIGNLSDITLRALQTLAGATAIACEDTRITRRLLERFAIGTPLTSYHEHNAAEMRPRLLRQIADGAAIALVSDAGTPLISDPGFKLVREAYAAGVNVTTLPGASSVLAALTLSALPTDRFFFEGFLPSKMQARRNRIGELSSIDATLVLFESGARVQATLQDLASLWGTRQAAICRELTKLHEEIITAPLRELAARADDLETRGEFVLVIAPPDPDAAMSEDAIDDALRAALKTSSVRDAVAQVVALSGRNRREVYARALALTSSGASDE